MNKTFDIVTTSLSGVTALISIEYIYEILGIVTLVLSIVNILINAGFKIYTAIKQKKFKEITGTIDDTVNQLNNLDKHKKDE